MLILQKQNIFYPLIFNKFLYVHKHNKLLLGTINGKFPGNQIKILKMHSTQIKIKYKIQHLIKRKREESNPNSSQTRFYYNHLPPSLAAEQHFSSLGEEIVRPISLFFLQQITEES